VVENSKNIKFIEGVLSRIMGKNVGVKFILLEGIPSAAATLEEAKENTITEEEQEAQAESTNGFINELLDTFGGKIHTDDE
jgi:hypothetical protein